MSDGREFALGTSFLTEFFEMSDGYSGDDITEIICQKPGKPIHREHAYFTCRVDGL